MAQVAMDRLIQARQAQTEIWHRQALQLVNTLRIELNRSRKKYTGPDTQDNYDSSENELGIESEFKADKIIVSLRLMRDVQRFPRSETKIEFEFPKAANPQHGPIKITAYNRGEEKASITLPRTIMAPTQRLRKQVAEYVANLNL